MSGIKFKFGTGVFSQAVLYDDGYLTDVYTHPFARRKGYASRVMREVCRFADERKIKLNIHIHKYGKGGATKKQLAEFYARFGFVLCGDCGETMSRKPNKRDKKDGFDSEVKRACIHS